jgi:serine/threonine protein kinase
MSSSNPIGTTLEGKYRIESKIGAGGFGTVYRAFHLGLGQPVAVKLLNAGLDHATEEDIARFRQEAASAFRLKHPNAVTVYDFGVTTDGVAYLVMELLEGKALSHELYQTGAMTPQRAAEILIPVCSVLAEAHAEGVIHRDIKPDNIFLNQGKRGEIVKVVDFGIAKLVDAAATSGRQSSTGLVGTPAYLSPERLQNLPYDGRADVYSVGIMFYQMLAGRVPFKTTDPGNVAALLLMHVTNPPPPFSELGIDVPPNVEGIVRAALEKNPANRPTASQLAHMISESTGVVVPSLSASGFPAAVPALTTSVLPPSLSEIPTQISDDALRPSALLPETAAIPTGDQPEGATIPLGAASTPREPVSQPVATGTIRQDTRGQVVAPPPPTSSKKKVYAAAALGAVLLLGGGMFAAKNLWSSPPAQNAPARIQTGTTTSPTTAPPAVVSETTPPETAKKPAKPSPGSRKPAPPTQVEPPAPPRTDNIAEERRRAEEIRKQREKEAEEARRRSGNGFPVKIDPNWRNGVPPGVPPGLWRKWKRQQQQNQDRPNRRDND